MLRISHFQESYRSKPVEKSMIFSMDFRKLEWLLRLA